MRGFRSLEPGEEPPEEGGTEVFRVTGWDSGIIGLYIQDATGLSLFEIANILHDMSTDIAKFVHDAHEKAKEN